LLGLELHRDDVGTGARFGHGEGAEMLAGNEFRQIARLLFLRGVQVDLVNAEIGMRAVGKADRAAPARNFLHRDDMGEIAEPRSAEFLIRRNAEQAEFPELRPEVARELVLSVDRRCAGFQTIVDPARDHLAHFLDLLGQAEIEVRNIAGHGSSPPCRTGFFYGLAVSLSYIAIVRQPDYLGPRQRFYQPPGRAVPGRPDRGPAARRSG